MATKKELAAKAGVNPRTLRRMERGETVSLETRRKVSDALDDVRAPVRTLAISPYVEALSSMRAGRATASERHCFDLVLALPFFATMLSVCLAFMAVKFNKLGGSPAIMATLALFMLVSVPGIIAGALSIGPVLNARRRIACERSKDANVVLEGIRSGMLIHISDVDCWWISKLIGKSVLAEAIDEAPGKVTISSV